jgi:hypothetical protein
LENCSVKNKFDYDKGDSNWTIELSIAIKVAIDLPFDPPIRLFFDPKDIINNFGQCGTVMIQIVYNFLSAFWADYCILCRVNP